VDDFDKKIREGNYDYLNILKEIKKDGKQKVMEVIKNQIDQELEEIYKGIEKRK
jgi:hypothetical protein